MRRLLPALFLVYAGCNPSGSASLSPPQAVSTGPTVGAAPLAPVAAPTLPDGLPPLPDEIKGLAASTNAFGLDLFAKLRARKGNVVFSPVGLSTALIMVWAGARGETAAQMQKVLHMEHASGQALLLVKELVASYQDTARIATLGIVNELVGERTLSFQQPYLDGIGAAPCTRFDVLDFLHAPEAARQYVNSRTSEATQGRIKDVIPAGGVDHETRLVVTSATYALGGSMPGFQTEPAVKAPFHLTVSQSKDVPIRRLGSDFRFAAVEGVRLLEVPYRRGSLAMTLVLPEDPDGLDATEARLSQDTLQTWIRALTAYRVLVALPELEIDPRGLPALDDALKALGMPLAFDRDGADFSGIARHAEPQDRLYLGHVFQRALVKLDDAGSEASTAVPSTTRHSQPWLPRAEFHADHPFLFFIRDVRSGLILFMGRVSDPTTK